jgi:hypothetical protein
MSSPEPLELAVRAWAVVEEGHEHGDEDRSNYRDLGASELAIAFDTETFTDAAQGLRVGGYQVWWRQLLQERGLFYEPGALSSKERRILMQPPPPT